MLGGYSWSIASGAAGTAVFPCAWRGLNVVRGVEVNPEWSLRRRKRASSRVRADFSGSPFRTHHRDALHFGRRRNLYGRDAKDTSKALFSRHRDFHIF